jgi:hypothetical protein
MDKTKTLKDTNIALQIHLKILLEAINQVYLNSNKIIVHCYVIIMITKNHFLFISNNIIYTKFSNLIKD